MREIGKSAPKLAPKLALVTLTTLAVGGTTAVTATAQETAASGHRIAVVDVAFIFKNHPEIKKQVAAVQKDLENYDTQLKAKRDELKQAAAQLQTLDPSSADYATKAERVASMESKLRINMDTKRRQLQDAEAKIYYENYKVIAAGVAYFADTYNINLVLRYNSDEMDAKKGESVIRSVMKNIVYHDPGVDMTKGIMQYLDSPKAAQVRASLKR